MILKRKDLLKVLAGAAVAGMVSGSMNLAFGEDYDDATEEMGDEDTATMNCSGKDGCEGGDHEMKTTETKPKAKAKDKMAAKGKTHSKVKKPAKGAKAKGKTPARHN